MYRYNNADVATNYTITAEWSSTDRLEIENQEIAVAENVRNADSLYGVNSNFG
jgi:hypothetical protein